MNNKKISRESLESFNQKVNAIEAGEEKKIFEREFEKHEQRKRK